MNDTEPFGPLLVCGYVFAAAVLGWAVILAVIAVTIDVLDLLTWLRARRRRQVPDLSDVLTMGRPSADQPRGDLE